MKIGIVGTGNMGRMLGGLWAVKGHPVFFGARRPQQAEEAAHLAASQGAQKVFFGPNADAAAFGEVLVYSPRGVDIRTVVPDASALDEKVVIDLNNQAIPDGFAFEPVSISLAERIQEQAPHARVVKAFNTLAMEVFEAEPEALRAARVTVFIATDDAGARKTVEALARDLNLTPVDAGPLRNARLLENVGDLVRYLIGGTKLGPMTTISVAVVPEKGSGSFGGRRASTLDEGQKTLQSSRVMVEASRVIDATVERLWAEVANFNNVAAWHPDVTESRLEAGATGQNPGEIRIIKLRKGTGLRERLVAIDPDTHRYAYSVLDDQLPLKSHVSWMSMQAVDAQHTRVTWSASFEPAGAPADALADGVRSDVLELGLQGLASRVRPA